MLTLRHNLTQELLADIHTVSQATISRVAAVYTPLIAEALQAWAPSVGDLDPDRQYIIDGTLAPCWSWRDRPELYSGKHHTTGVNLQVACTLAGHLAWISPPLPGSMHDAKAIKESGFLTTLNGQSHIGDKGYIGLGMITPVKKPAHGELTDTDKRNNTTINRVRYLIERVIANLKTWRVLHTDYRRPYNTFETTIQAVTGLIFAYTPCISLKIVFIRALIHLPKDIKQLFEFLNIRTDGTDVECSCTHFSSLAIGGFLPFTQSAQGNQLADMTARPALQYPRHP